MFCLGFFATEPVNNEDPAGVLPPRTDSGPADPDLQRDNDDIRRFLDGDIQGFESIMTRYRQRAYGIALSLTGNHDDAMDSMQKAFIRVHRSLDRFRLGEPFFPWLYRIVRNVALNQRRDERRHKGDVPLEWVNQTDGRPDPLAVTEADELRRRLWYGIQSLPTEMREVFVLYHFQGMKYREIAGTCHVPIGTVMSRLHAARLRLREALDAEAET